MPNKKNRKSISEAITISLGLHSDNIKQPSQANRRSSMNPENSSNYYLGRSYVGSFSSPSFLQRESSADTGHILSLHKDASKSIHESVKLHRQTAALSNDFDDSSDGKSDEIDVAASQEFQNEALQRELSLENGSYSNSNNNNQMAYSEDAITQENNGLNECTRLLSPTSAAATDLEYGTSPTNPSPPSSQYEQEQYVSLVADHSPSSAVYDQATGDGDNAFNTYHSLRQPVVRSYYDYAKGWSIRTLNYMPAVILGLLLNVLDALSYGMIIFPITEPVFSHLGPTGLSMFYVSTILSQLVYSCGFSAFGNGIGSEMIEITPFFHTMALSIMNSLPGHDDEIISTTIVCYALSSIFTGLAFFLLGKLRLGKIVGFFPRHILIGCVGGVGYFLLITGIEVCTRVSKFEYSWPFLRELFYNTEVLGKWMLPLILTLSLIVTQHYFNNSLVLPSFYIITLALFHFVVAIVPSLSLNSLRESGWIFPMAGSSNHWYGFYKLYNFQNVHWTLVLKQVPTMLALTFFGILHVPINVPALAMSIGMDKFDVDKELIAHGYSNLLSGFSGSIQNYLVYTNSFLFIRAGSDSSWAGFLLALGTFVVMIIGPVIISFIPICIVGSLIFLLGYELIKEALFDTWGKLNHFEYITIVIIVFTMGVFDFVLGIIVGILIACFSFLVDSTKLQTINGEFNGQVARSTVYRDYIQTKFLNKVGEQIHVLKLQNLLFFGTIISIEEKIDELLEISDKDSSRQRIKYLILDFKNINADNIDYSAAEGFNRIKRFTETKRIQLIISSITERDRIYNAFNKVGLLQDVELFADLNSALEWCENEFLLQYKQIRTRTKAKLQAQKKQEKHLSKSLLPINTPRNNQIVTVAQKIFPDEQNVTHLRTQYQKREPVLPLLLVALKKFRPQIMSYDKDVKQAEEDFWSKLCPYFVRKRFAPGSLLLHNNNLFFLVESGMLKITYDLHQGQFYETMSSKTCYGRISGNADFTTNLYVSIKTETDCAVWIIDATNLANLKEKNLALYAELLLVVMSINQYRSKELLGYSLVSS